MSRLALVTGGNRGIGHEVVNQLSKKGIDVIYTARSNEKALEVLGDFDAEKVKAHQLDITDSASIQELRTWIEDKYGKLDILINNAGINYDTWNKAVDPDMNNVRETFDTNLFGTWNMCIAMIPLLMKSDSGRIVNVSSGAGSLNEMIAEAPGYSFSKAALNGLTIH